MVAVFLFLFCCFCLFLLVYLKSRRRGMPVCACLFDRFVEVRVAFLVLMQRYRRHLPKEYKNSLLVVTANHPHPFLFFPAQVKRFVEEGQALDNPYTPPCESTLPPPEVKDGVLQLCDPGDVQ